MEPPQAAIAILREFESRFACGEVPPVPVERIAESLLGLLIDEIDDARDVPNAPSDRGRLSGLIEPETQTIWLDRHESTRSPGRRRYTIAHECGHWVLHIAGPGDVICCRPQDISGPPEAEDRELVRQLRRQEREANAFADELLMPEVLVYRQAKETGCNLSLLAERFDVSAPAIRLRLLRLGLLPAWMAKAPKRGRR
ncbi:MAG TPA: ImmA/IrrE family metallo-endopeptidase [Solirubrobacteraceae bacterium]